MSRAKIALAVSGALTSANARPQPAVAQAVERLEPRRLLAGNFTDISADYETAPLVVGGGGYVMGMTIHPDVDVRYMWADVGGAQRRTGVDGEWVQLAETDHFADFESDVKLGPTGYRGGGVDTMGLSVSDPDVVYMAYADRVYRSDNRGDLWTPTSLDVNTYANGDIRRFAERFAVDPDDADTVYFASDAGLSKSTDGGASWSTVAPTVLPAGQPGTGAYLVATDPDDGDIVYAAVDGASLAVSGDAWVSLPTNYTITGGSKLRFNFSSADQGQVHAIGLDTDNDPSNGYARFELYGTEATSPVDGRKEGTYAERVSTVGIGQYAYEIALTGDLVGQQIERVVFINDNDGTGETQGSSVYTDVRFEGGGQSRKNLDLAGVTPAVYNAAETGQYRAGVYEGGLFRSTDGGASWSRMTQSATKLDSSRRITDINFFTNATSSASDNTAIFTADSRNSGGHDLWKYRTGAAWGPGGDDILSIDPRPNEQDRYRGVAIDPNNAGVFLVEGVSHQPALVTDTGANATKDDFVSFGSEIDRDDTEFLWMEESVQEGYVEFSKIVFDPHYQPPSADLSRLWITTGIGSARADNFRFDAAAGTASYTSEIDTSGNEEMIGQDLLSVPGKPWILTAVQDKVGYRFVDPSGRNAQRFYPQKSLHFGYDLAFRPNDPDYVAMTAFDKQAPNDPDAYLSGYSTNGGLTWQVFDSIDADGDGLRDADSQHPENLRWGSVVPGTSGPGFENNLVWMPNRSADGSDFLQPPSFSLDNGASWQQPLVWPDQPDGTPLESQAFAWSFRWEGLAADPTTPGTFYLYLGRGDNQGDNFLVTTDGGDTWSVAPAPGGIFAFHAKLLHALGPDGSPDASLKGDLWASRGAGSTQGGKLWRSTTDAAGNVTGWVENPVVDEVVDFAFGKGAPGSDYPTIFLAGTIDGQVGIFRSVDEGASWQFLVDYPAGIAEEPQSIEGDWNEFGRFYVALKGNGFAYGDDSPLPTGPDDRKPTPSDDEAATAADQPITIDVLANDIDPDGDVLSVVDVAKPREGTVAFDADTITYTPRAGFSGLDTFAYTVADPGGLVAVAEVVVRVDTGSQTGVYVDGSDFAFAANALDDYTAGTTPTGVWHTGQIAPDGGNPGAHVAHGSFNQRTFYGIDVSALTASETWDASFDFRLDVGNAYGNRTGMAVFGLSDGQTITKQQVSAFFATGQLPPDATLLSDPEPLTLPPSTTNTNGWVTLTDAFDVDLAQFDDVVVVLFTNTSSKATSNPGAPGVRAFDNVLLRDPNAQPAQQSFLGPRNVVNGSAIEAEHYDTGGQGVAFNDDATKSGNASFRPGDNVDVGDKSNAGGGKSVGWTQNGEWLEYTIDAATPGDYDLSIRYASGRSSGVGDVRVLLDGGGGFDLLGTIDLGPTGGWNAFSQSKLADPVALVSGRSVLRLEIVGGGFDLDTLAFADARDALRVNFQPDGHAAPAGYVADVGLAYGDRGDGLAYGWVGGDNLQTRDRATPADDRLDTLNHLQKNGASHAWRAAVANGRYRLILAAGDPSFSDNVNRFLVEGVTLGDSVAGSDFFEVEIEVVDGYLDLALAAGASNAKVQYLDLIPA